MKLLIAMLLAMSAPAFAKKHVILNSGNTAVMSGQFNYKNVSEVQQKLAQLSAETKEDLYLVLNSPGGSISAGESLIEFANALPNKVHTITIFAASMAYLTAQHLNKRYILSSGVFMSHRARIGGLSGQVPGEANKRLHYVGKTVRRLSQNVADRVGVTYNDYMQSIYNELWLNSFEAVEKNHADEIITASCDKSLNGTHIKNISTFFGTFQVRYSNCPLIEGPLKVYTGQRRNTLMDLKIRDAISAKTDFKTKDLFTVTF